MLIDLVSAITAWVISVIGDSGIPLALGTRDQRALRKVMRKAIKTVVGQAQTDSRKALKRGLQLWFSSAPRLRLDPSISMSDGLQAAIAAQLPSPEEWENSDTGQLFYDDVGVDPGWL